MASRSRIPVLLATLAPLLLPQSPPTPNPKPNPTPPTPQSPPSPSLNQSIHQATALLQSSASTWTNEVGCFSCHHQGMGSLAIAMSEELGFPIDEAAAKREADEVWAHSRKRFDAMLVCDGVGVFGRATTLIALGARKRPKDAVTDAVTHFLSARQARGGVWNSNEHRPPFEDSHVTATALTIRALQLYTPHGRAEEMRARIQAGRDWLQARIPVHNEERSMRLLGLAWAGVSREELQEDAQDLWQQQRKDGGWAQLPTRRSDAYATGQALVALNQAAGFPAQDPRWQRGARYLLRTQANDGSWFVPTRRRVKGLPQADSGFPYEKNQFVSYFASSWATMALALALTAHDGSPTETLFGTIDVRSPSNTPEELGLPPLIAAAAFGTAEELAALLEQGSDPDVRGPQGLTALMLAAHDLAKVEALIESGADVRASSDWNNTPLLQAVQVSGAGGVVQRLLELEASVDGSAANGASSLFAAANLGDLDTLDRLVEAGGTFVPGYAETAIVYAADCDDVATVARLLELGADPDQPAGGLKFTALIAATTAGYEDTVRLLLEKGARVDATDAQGFSPIHWAAKSDPGHTRIVDLLLAAGADPCLEGPDGRTPAMWAKRFRAHHIERRIQLACEERR